VRKVLVTGSTRGIGLKIAEQLLRNGFDVVINGRNKEAASAKEALVQLSEICPGRRFLEFDVANREQTAQTLNEELSNYGAFYGVVLCAGVTKDAPFPALTGEDWDFVIGTNLDGFFNVLRPLILPMIQLRSGGRVVALSSLSGVIGNRGQVAYSAAKAGLIGASKACSKS